MAESSLDRFLYMDISSGYVCSNSREEEQLIVQVGNDVVDESH